MEVKTILWPTDLSKNSLKALRHVVSLAEKYGAKVVVMYVGTDLTSMLTAYGYPNQEHLESFREWELKHAREEIQKLCSPELKACRSLEIKLAEGDAAAEILKAADEVQADMIVLTTHGRGHGELDQRTPAFGSVAAKVVRGAKVPIHIVNPFMES